jgi:hypothetical protein
MEMKDGIQKSWTNFHHRGYCSRSPNSSTGFAIGLGVFQPVVQDRTYCFPPDGDESFL